MTRGVWRLANSVFKESALGRFFHRVAMSVCPSVCLCVPFHAFFFEASHWPSGHMTRSRPLIGQPQVQASGYLVQLTNDIILFRNNTAVLPVFPGLNRKLYFIKTNRVDSFATDPHHWSSTTGKTQPLCNVSWCIAVTFKQIIYFGTIAYQIPTSRILTCSDS